MRSYFLRTILLLVIIHIAYVLFAQPVNWKTTEKVYTKFSRELSLNKTQKITKLNKSTYIMSREELSKMNSNDILFMSPIWQSEQGLEQYAIDNSIILYDVYSLSMLIKENNLGTNVISVDSIAGKPLIYILSLRNMSYEQIDSLCAIFIAKSYCKIAEPNYVIFSSLQDDISPAPENNTYYAEQWGFHNNIYPLYDINAREAWRISTGEGIKVAIIDVGFELTHPDLYDNIYSSYDYTDGEDGALNGAYGTPIDSHGTQCAGVIGAVNNSIGVVGVAPHSKLILIRRGYTVCSGGDTIFYAQTAWHINALRAAYQLGADVISNSWSMDESSNNYTIFDEVLEEAYTLGRFGKGAVVVFSTGNQYKTFINYPSNSPYTISVGAMNNMGYRCAFSNYGKNLDVVAPGYNIKTTQIIPKGNYCYSSGTSFAAPMVAGVAALMLAVNSELTSSQVGNIIRSTAYKLSNYSFDSSYVCGSWDNNVGYGLVDAYASVIAAAGGFIQGPDYVCDTTKYYLIHPSQPGDTVTWSVSNGVWQYPHYSIVGPANQDTVYVRCERMTPVGPPNPPDYLNGGGRSLYDQKLMVTISNGTTKTYEKLFREPQGETPVISASNSSTQWRSGSRRTFTISNCSSTPDNALRWEVRKIVMPFFGNNDTTFTYYTGRTLSYRAPSVTGIVQLRITAINTHKECDPNYASLIFLVSSAFSLNAYTDNGTLQVEINEQDEETRSVESSLNKANTYSLELWHNIYGCMRSQTVQSMQVQMDINGLPQGVYVLLLKENGNVIADTKVRIL